MDVDQAWSIGARIRRLRNDALMMQDDLAAAAGVSTDLVRNAVGSGCGQLKAGAPARGERVAKYNRLLEIGISGLPYGLPG